MPEEGEIMQSFIYPYKPSIAIQKKPTISRASAVVLALVSLHPPLAHAQSDVPNNPANPTSTAQEKYQKLLDAGIFSAGNTPASLDTPMTRTEFVTIAAKLQILNAQTESTPFSNIDPSSSTGVAATKLGIMEGVSGESNSSATLADLFNALNKMGVFDQNELDQLKAKLKANSAIEIKAGELRTVSSAANVEAIRDVNNTVAEIVPTFQGAVTTSGITGISSEALAALSLALSAAAAASSIAASSSANNIALENATNPGANYTVVLPRSNWPTNLSATYSGRLTGTMSDSSLVGGNLSMNVNFATIRNAAAIPGSVLFDNGKGSASLSLVQFNGFVGGGMNGTYNGQTMTGNIINGQFYGPSAEAVKGSWSMATPTASGGGVFAATR
jgi:hypothetical protein